MLRQLKSFVPDLSYSWDGLLSLITSLSLQEGMQETFTPMGELYRINCHTFGTQTVPQKLLLLESAERETLRDVPQDSLDESLALHASCCLVMFTVQAS